jgi:TctA family transporter
VRPTTWRLLGAVAVVAGLITWSVLRVWAATRGELPDVPVLTAVVIGVFGATVLIASFVLRPRVRHEDGHRPLDPLVSARFAVLGMASSRAGALFVGVYGAFAATAVTDLTIDFRRHVALVSGLCVVAAVLLVVGGLRLERLFRLPPPETADAPGGDNALR